MVKRIYIGLRGISSTAWSYIRFPCYITVIYGNLRQSMVIYLYHKQQKREERVMCIWILKLHSCRILVYYISKVTPSVARICCIRACDSPLSPSASLIWVRGICDEFHSLQRVDLRELISITTQYSTYQWYMYSVCC